MGSGGCRYGDTPFSVASQAAMLAVFVKVHSQRTLTRLAEGVELGLEGSSRLSIVRNHVEVDRAASSRDQCHELRRPPTFLMRR